MVDSFVLIELATDPLDAGLGSIVGEAAQLQNAQRHRQLCHGMIQNND
jgi:hypothetical protein